MKIKFLGAATSVTGSCHLITTDRYKILLDCGQFQGSDETDALNWVDFDFDPAEIDFVLLSHAHIDHSGRLPLLVKRGFRGRVYCTSATADLLDVMLKDSAYIHEKEAEWKNRKNQRAGRPFVEPLYTVEDAIATLEQIAPVLYQQPLSLNEDIKVNFNDAGHILGSAIIELFVQEHGTVSKIVFSGDLGTKNRPILKDPAIIQEADYLIMETTYGNRVHEENSNSIENLVNIVCDTIKRGGTVVIPSFAVGRTQELIYEFSRFFEAHTECQKILDHVMVYIDSPMAISVTEIFKKHAQDFDDETKAYILQGDNPLEFRNLRFTRSTEESKALNLDASPKIIIAASGMCEAGRIKHHLKYNLWNKKSSIIFVGYQAEGTLGRFIINGAKEVSIFGEKIHVAAEIYNLEGFSGHADQNGLLDWLSGFQARPRKIFLVHGEAESKKDFAALVKSTLGYDCTVVEEVSEYTLAGMECHIQEAVAQKAVSLESLRNIRRKISAVHDNMETILYHTDLAVKRGLSIHQANEVNKIVQEIGKNMKSLGLVLSKDDGLLIGNTENTEKRSTDTL